MKKCDLSKEELLLFALDELQDIHQARVEHHLSVCADCRRELLNLQMLHDHLPAAPPIPDEKTLAALRSGITRRIRGDGTTAVPSPWQRFGYGIKQLLYPAPLARLALALLLFVCGFFLGRQNGATSGDEARTDLAALLNASGNIEQENHTIQPLLIGIDHLKYDPVSREIEMRYTTRNDISYRGSVLQAEDDPATWRMLRKAIMDESNTAVRLHAVKALTSLAERETIFSREIVEALLLRVEREKNLGVRLKTLRALRAFLPDPLAKTALVKLVLNDAEPALRIEALDALLSQPAAAEDRGIFQRLARQDSSAYIRSISAALVGEPLEE